jgi:uncharacterized membrane protein
MAFCGSCGTDVTGVSWCPKCGAAVAGAAAPAGAAASSGAAQSAATSGGATAPAGAATPPAAGAATPPPAAGAAAQGGLADNVAGALAYVTIIPAIIFLVIEPFKNIKFVRFHALQCLFYGAVCIILQIGLSVLSFVLAFVGVGFLGTLLIPLLMLGIFVGWIILVLKAYQGQQFKLPLIGDMAAKYA